MLAARVWGKGKGRRVGIDVEGGKLVWVKLKLKLEAIIHAWERLGIIAERRWVKVT